MSRRCHCQGDVSNSVLSPPGIAIASSLVTLGNPRKVSVDPTQKLEAETGAKSRKSRKVVGVASGNAPTDL